MEPNPHPTVDVHQVAQRIRDAEPFAWKTFRGSLHANGCFHVWVKGWGETVALRVDDGLWLAARGTIANEKRRHMFRLVKVTEVDEAVLSFCKQHSYLKYVKLRLLGYLDDHAKWTDTFNRMPLSERRKCYGGT